MPFIQDLLIHTREYESPSSFWKWSAYSAISAVLRDNCYRRHGDSYLFPNIYVLLLAGSAVHRKGSPVKLCEQLVRKVNSTKTISGRASIQAILDELAHSETDAKTGKIVQGGSAIFFAEELAASIVADDQAVGILTDIYDNKPDYTERLRGRGKSKIDRLVFSMFAASNEALLKSVYNASAIAGGLLGRTFLIVPNEFRPGNDFFDLSIEDIDKRIIGILSQLKKISELKGEFNFEDMAKKEYRSWYIPFRESYAKKSDTGGIAGRLHTGVIKLSMLLAANDITLEVCKCHMEEAINECIALLPNYNHFIMSTGKSTISEAASIVLADLLVARDNVMKRELILREHWGTFDAMLLDSVVTTLEQAGLIRTEVSKAGVHYRLTAACIEKMQSQQAQKEEAKT